MTDWEPKPSERTYYRSRLDGQRAYLVKREGKECLRLDRPSEAIYHAINGDWVQDAQQHVANAHQVAKVAFIADRALCPIVGAHTEAKDEWINLKEQDRIKFMQDGPDTGDIRDDLFRAITKTLKELTGG
jgi:hypothetical protein